MISKRSEQALFIVLLRLPSNRSNQRENYKQKSVKKGFSEFAPEVKTQKEMLN